MHKIKGEHIKGEQIILIKLIILINKSAMLKRIKNFFNLLYLILLSKNNVTFLTDTHKMKWNLTFTVNLN